MSIPPEGAPLTQVFNAFNTRNPLMHLTETKRTARRASDRSGKIKYGIFAWLLGLPLPIILIALFFGGCDF
jgi:hypothetical protein